MVRGAEEGYISEIAWLGNTLAGAISKLLCWRFEDYGKLSFFAAIWILNMPLLAGVKVETVGSGMGRALSKCLWTPEK